MIKLLLICLATIVMISCGSEQEKLTVYIPDTCTDTLQYEIFLPEEEGLNIFYDLCVTDSFCAFLYLHAQVHRFCRRTKELNSNGLLTWHCISA